MKVWIDGALLDESTARVSPFDHGLLVGDGVFETLRVYDGVPFAWTRHGERLRRSATGLGLDPPPFATLRAAAEAVLAANDVTEGRLRITVTGGPAPLGSERGDVPPTVIVAAGPARTWPEVESVVIAPWTRNEHSAVAGFKTTSYAENVRALAYASERGATEAVFANTRGDLCEATGSNVFVAHAGKLRTPTSRAGCLLGVTRALVLELCERHDLAAEEHDEPIAALASSDEAFLTSSTREVQPISDVDGRALPAAPGPMTAKLAALFGELVRTDLDP